MFVRLTGCPLRCQYCDTAYAFSGGELMTLDAIGACRCLQSALRLRDRWRTAGSTNCVPLLQRLCDAGYEVSLETSGALDISPVDERVSRVVDLKPGLGGSRTQPL